MVICCCSCWSSRVSAKCRNCLRHLTGCFGSNRVMILVQLTLSRYLVKCSERRVSRRAPSEAILVPSLQNVSFSVQFLWTVVTNTFHYTLPQRATKIVDCFTFFTWSLVVSGRWRCDVETRMFVLSANFLRSKRLRASVNVDIAKCNGPAWKLHFIEYFEIFDKIKVTKCV